MNRLLVCAVAALLSVSAVTAAPKRNAPPRKPAAPAAAKPKRAVAATPAVVNTEHRRTPYVGAASAVVDGETIRILSEDNADVEAYPASVTKLMTLLLVIEDVAAGRYSFDDLATATADAYLSEPSWVGIKAGEQMSVRSLCIALMVESANDAAIVLGVNSAGSLDAFVERMNSRARELGMTRTKYHNPNGLPPGVSGKRRYPWKSYNTSTARDQLQLAQALLKYPVTLEFTAIKTADLVKTESGYRMAVTRRVNEPQQTTELADGEKLVKSMNNHNNVMRMDKFKILNPDGKEAVDGLKTGYINAGGSSVVLTGARGGRRVIVVVLGSTGAAERDENAARLMTDALGAVAW